MRGVPHTNCLLLAGIGVAAAYGGACLIATGNWQLAAGNINIFITVPPQKSATAIYEMLSQNGEMTIHYPGAISYCFFHIWPMQICATIDIWRENVTMSEGGGDRSVLASKYLY